MPLKVRGKDFPPASEGAHQAVLAAIVDVGEVENSFGKVQEVMRFIWLLDEPDAETGDPMMVFQRVPKSTHPKSTYAKTVKGMTGRVAEPDDDALELLGMPATVMIEHTEKEGRTYGNIVLVVKPSKTEAPVEIPDDWTAPQHRKGEGETFLAGATAVNAARSQETEAESAGAGVADEDSIPF
jgi:hypothetical protein